MKSILSTIFILSLATAAAAQATFYGGPVGYINAVTLTATSSATASAFIGDGSKLTNITATIDANTITSSLTVTGAGGVGVTNGITGATLGVSTVTLLQNGATGDPSFPSTPLLIKGNTNGYFQTVLQNLSNGTNASGDMVLTNDLGGDASYYMDIGMNSSKFSQAGQTAEASSSTFISSSDSDLLLWAGTNGLLNGAASETVILGSSNPVTGNRAAVFSSSTISMIAPTTFTGAVTHTNIALTATGAGGNIISASSITTTGALFGNGLAVGGSSITSAGALILTPSQSFTTSGSGGDHISASSITTTGGLFGKGLAVGGSSITAAGALTLTPSQAINVSGANGNIISASSITTTGLVNGTVVTATSGTITNMAGAIDGSNASPTSIGYSTCTIGITGAGPTGVALAVSTLTLTAGEWDVTGQVAIQTGGSTAMTQAFAGISASNTSQDSTSKGGLWRDTRTFAVNGYFYGALSPRRVSITSSTPYYLVVILTYTVAGGVGSSGSDTVMCARRVH